MASVVENLQPAGGPSLGQLPGGHQWSTYIEASMDEHARDAVQLCGVPNQLVLLEKRRVPPIVSNEASEPQTKLGILVARIWSVTRGQRDMGVFPGAPFPGSEITDNRIRVRKHPSIGFDRSEVPKLFRDGIDKTFPMLRKHAPDVLGDPLHFAMRSRCDEREHQCIDPIGVSLGVGQSERAAPRQTKNGPPINAAQLTQRLDIGNQMRCRIGAEIGVGIACQWPAATRAALVEKHRVVKVRVEEAPLTG